ncbi:MAG: peptide-methionine (S)-S-oxide reductase MsrA [Propionibacteriaceae bacterium]
MLFGKQKVTMVEPDRALAGRERTVLADPTFHEIFGIPVQSVPAGSEVVYLALGCFWGAEKLYWNAPGVTNTAAGYAGGFTQNPTYEEVCSARTGHTEIVKVSYDPTKTSLEKLLKIFFENHDPTQGMRQGNDVGTQYRSAIYTTSPEQAEVVGRVLAMYQTEFERSGYRRITTEVKPIRPAGEDTDDFFYAEDYHQQYLDKNPFGYCPVHATGVTCNVG